MKLNKRALFTAMANKETNFKQLAYESGISTATLNKMYRGKAANVQFETLCKISKTLQIDVNELILD